MNFKINNFFKSGIIVFLMVILMNNVLAQIKMEEFRPIENREGEAGRERDPELVPEIIEDPIIEDDAPEEELEAESETERQLRIINSIVFRENRMLFLDNLETIPEDYKEKFARWVEDYNNYIKGTIKLVESNQSKGSMRAVNPEEFNRIESLSMGDIFRMYKFLVKSSYVLSSSNKLGEAIGNNFSLVNTMNVFVENHSSLGANGDVVTSLNSLNNYKTDLNNLLNNLEFAIYKFNILDLENTSEGEEVITMIRKNLDESNKFYKIINQKIISSSEKILTIYEETAN